MLAAGEGGVALSAAEACCGAGKEDGAASRASASFCRITTDEKSGKRAHLPDFPIDAGGRFGDSEAHIAADIEDNDPKRPDVSFDPYP